MYRIVLISRAAGADAIDEAGRCLVMISQASGLELEIEVRDLDEAAARSGLALACLRADAAIVVAPELTDPDREALDQSLGLYAEFQPVLSSSLGGGEAGDLLLVYPYRRASEPGSADVERLARAAFLAAERRSKRVTFIVADAATDSWRGAVTKVAKLHPEVALETMDAQAAALLVEARPGRFDVLLASDSDAAALRRAAGSGTSSGTIIAGDSGPFLFSASASGGAVSTIEAAALMLDFALDRPDLAILLRGAREAALVQDEVGRFAGEGVRSLLAERLGARNAHLQLMAMNRGCCG